MSGTRIRLLKDSPKDGLAAGAVGVAVLAYPNGIVEVEFLDAAGARKALLTLRPGEFQKL